MVYTAAETETLEKVRQSNKLELMERTAMANREEHVQKMEHLDKMLEIAKAGGVRMGAE